MRPRASSLSWPQFRSHNTIIDHGEDVYITFPNDVNARISIPPCFSLKGTDHIANENLALFTTKTTSRIGGAPSFQVVQGIVAKKTK